MTDARAFARRMGRLRRERDADLPEGVDLGAIARRACGRALFRVSGGGVTWWVQAPTWKRAGLLVRAAMRAEGASHVEIRDYCRTFRIEHQTWAQCLDTTFRDSGQQRSMLSVFVGGRDEVLACSEWDG